jgi:hypothetical protein
MRWKLETPRSVLTTAVVASDSGRSFHAGLTVAVTVGLNRRHIIGRVKITQSGLT